MDPEVAKAKAEKLKAAAARTASKGGLNPWAVLFLLVAIAVGIYLSQNK